MKAALAEELGTWSKVLKIVDLPPIDDVPPDAIHVRVTACGMGFRDLLMIEGKHQDKPAPPFVPVVCTAGQVVALGSDVTFPSLEVGDRVVGSAGHIDGQMRGGLAQEALLDPNWIHRLPDFISDEVALCMHGNYWDVHHAISTCGRVGPEDVLLVLGASGGCGMAAVDLGKAFGATVVACASSEDKLDACRKQGADQLVNYGEDADYDTFLATLREVELYGKITAVFDPVGGGYAEAAFRAMARGGRYVVFGFAAGGADPKSAFPRFPTNLLLMKGQQLIGSMGSSGGKAIDEMFQMVKDGRLNPIAGGTRETSGSARRYEIDNFQKAFSDIANRKAVGKVVIHVDCNANEA